MDGIDIYCRFCAEQKQHHSMINLQVDSILFQEILDILSFLNANYIDLSETNPLPKTVCISCYETLVKTSEFLNEIKSAQTILNSIFLKSIVIKSEFTAVCTANIKPESLQDSEVLNEVFLTPSSDILCKSDDEDSNDDCPLSISALKYSSRETIKNKEIQKPGSSWSDYPWSCSHCNEKFTTISLLRDHSRGLHGQCCAYQCADCGLKATSYDALVEHAREHRTYLRLYCQYCNLHHEDCKTTAQHTESHKNTQYICDFCGKIFTKPILLSTHTAKFKPNISKIRTRTKNEARITKNVLVVPTSNVKDKSWTGYHWQCKICSLRFDDVQKLRFHTKKEHSKCFAMKCVDCLEDMDSFRSFVDHVLKHRPFLKKHCQYCNFKFEPGKDMEHIAAHFTGPAKVCEGCGETLKNQEDLQNHIKTYNPPKPKRIPFKKRERPITVNDLTCDICNKVTKSLSNLYSHKLLHTERNRNYTCDRCGKAFFTKGTLSAHIVVHENPDPQICKICKKTFLTVTRLKKHISSHYADKPFQCAQCKRGFRLKEQLKCHMITHTDVMPYRCNYCEKSFRHRTVLKTHENQHTGVRPYACTQCAMDFTNWSNCNKHMKRKHGTTLAKTILTAFGKLPINTKTGLPKPVNDLNSVSDWKKEIMEPRKRGKKTNLSQNVFTDPNGAVG